tara:strand:+ start:62 stop:247 length:186 start_codon:yes stop_codon:yes gene_type:complete
MEEVFNELYCGKYNVCVGAEKAGVTPEEMKRLVREYILERPLDTSAPEVWSGDVELGWPWV